MSKPFCALRASLDMEEDACDAPPSESSPSSALDAPSVLARRLPLIVAAPGCATRVEVEAFFSRLAALRLKRRATVRRCEKLGAAVRPELTPRALHHSSRNPTGVRTPREFVCSYPVALR